MEGFEDRTSDMSEELENAKTFVREGRAIIAFDSVTNRRLGLVTFALGTQYPFGSESFGEFTEKYLWCSYVWTDPSTRGLGVARSAVLSPFHGAVAYACRLDISTTSYFNWQSRLQQNPSF